jgi:hypothetical protein
MIARYATAALAAIAIAVTLLVWGNEASSSNLAALAALCSANPQCVQGGKDESGRMFFRIRNANAQMRLSCTGDGTCLRIEPKAPRASIVNAERLIAAK